MAKRKQPTGKRSNLNNAGDSKIKLKGEVNMKRKRDPKETTISDRALKRHFRDWKRKTPVLRGFIRRYRSGDATIQVWCPFCKLFHAHGWDDDWIGNMGGHRCCHCGSNGDPDTGNLASPFQETGYFIEPFPLASVRGSDIAKRFEHGPKPRKSAGRRLRD